MIKIKSPKNNSGNKKKLYLSVKEAAEYTGISEYYIRKYIKDGKIPYVETGVKFLINRIALKDYLKGQEK
ncbi:helix-turn-helix domain-containing protein [Lachnospiraceae bacterium MD329]|nr:helix-turn-helix domain-containing protein [Lachnospiraceae bacterium MD329]